MKVPGIFNMQNSITELQAKVLEAKIKAESQEVSGEDGPVTVILNGEGKVLSVKINATIVKGWFDRVADQNNAGLALEMAIKNATNNAVANMKKMTDATYREVFEKYQPELFG